MPRTVPEFARQRYLRADLVIEIDGVWLAPGDAVRSLGGRVHVLTAANPQGQDLPDADNTARNAELGQEIADLGLVAHAARGNSAEGQADEDGWAVAGLGRRRAKALGREWDQDAIYELTDTDLVVLGCFTSWERRRPLDHVPDRGDGVALDVAVLDALGIVVEPDFTRAFMAGWTHDGQPGVDCPSCGEGLDLFGADIAARDGTLYRATALVCSPEGTASLPHVLGARQRLVVKRWRDWLVASADADEDALEDRAYWAYVIELDDDTGPRRADGPPWLYVGQSSKPPEERFEQHLEGYKASKWVRRHGVRLRPDLCAHQPVLRTHAEALAYEAWLHAHLRAQGWPAKGGH